ncbi:hypothetical protein pb186bvf_013859 [Paramecium bursaria]
MSMKKTPNQSSGPRFIKDNPPKSRSEHNQSFDTSYNKSVNYQPTFQSRLKSYSHQGGNFLDDLEEEQYPQTINITLQHSQAEATLQHELQKILQRIQQGDKLNTDDLVLIVNTVNQCIFESAQTLKSKEQELKSIRNKYEYQLDQFQREIITIKNENQELRHILQLQGQDDNRVEMQRLMMENEKLRMENQQAIQLAVQGRNKKQEKELTEFISNKMKTSTSKPQVNNYAIQLNQQYNKIYPGKPKSQLF